MKGKVCACTGHRPQNLPFRFDETNERCVRLKEQLYKIIENLILKKGVTHFISGMAQGVDTYFAEIVLEFRDEKYPEITLEAAIPCETQAERWLEPQRDRYYSILSRCDKEKLLQTHYTDGCMQRRNEYMVDCCDYLIAVWDGSPSGTGSTVKYACERGKEIIQIDPITLENRGDGKDEVIYKECGRIGENRASCRGEGRSRKAESGQYYA